MMELGSSARVARLAILAALAALVPTTATAQSGRSGDPVAVVAAWLDSKIYAGAERAYAEADLAVPASVASAAEALGVSRFSLLRNEIYARRGYIFKTPALDTIFRATKWYRPDTGASLATLGVRENANVAWIKALEDGYDLGIVRDFLRDKDYYGSSQLYMAEYFYYMPPAVESALSHLGTNPARFLSWEIYARYGYAMPGVMEQALKGVYWFEKSGTTMAQTIGRMDKVALANLELLRYYEWPFMLKAVPYSVPAGVEMIPAVGYGAFFVRTLDTEGGTYYYSSHRVWDALVAGSGAIGDSHVTSAAGLVPAGIVEAIKAERDPRKKLILYFQNKKYRGYVDTVKFNQSDMAPPDYLKPALATLGIDWRRALRKEIHARNGARMFDADLTPIFSACAWYKGIYDLSPSTASRFPAAAKVTAIELSNYALLEGGELHDLYAGRAGAEAVVDLQGRLHFIRMISLDEGPVMGLDFDTRDAYDSASGSILTGEEARRLLLKRVEEKVGDLEGLYYEQYLGGGAGC